MRKELCVALLIDYYTRAKLTSTSRCRIKWYLSHCPQTDRQSVMSVIIASTSGQARIVLLVTTNSAAERAQHLLPSRQFFPQNRAITPSTNIVVHPVLVSHLLGWLEVHPSALSDREIQWRRTSMSLPGLHCGPAQIAAHHENPSQSLCGWHDRPGAFHSGT